MRKPFFLVPQFVLAPSSVAKESDPFLLKIFRVKFFFFFQFFRIQPRGESEGGSQDTPEPIFRMGVPRIHWPQKAFQLSQ